MYSVGDLIIYGGSNCVCEITDITELDFSADKGRLYYVLKPLNQDGIIYNPVDNANILMRHVISKDAAEKLIDMIPEITAEPYQGSELKQINEYYESILRTRDCGQLITLTMSIYQKKHFLMQNNRKFSAQEEMFMKRAEEMLFNELAVALAIPKGQVKAYIAARVGE
jgi:CarD family transcriptional regulator